MTLKRTTPNTSSHPSGVGEATYAGLVNTEFGEVGKRIICELGSVGGTATAITASVVGADALTALAAPMSFWFTPASNANAASTIAIDGLAAVDLVDAAGNALSTGGLVAGRRYLLTFDGADMRVMDASSLVQTILFLASGGVINWNAGDVTITHSANRLDFAGGASGYFFDSSISVDVGDIILARTTNAYGYIARPNTVGAKKLAFAVQGGGPLDELYITSLATLVSGGPMAPATSNGAALGTSSLMWSNLFLADGGLINWNNGAVTLGQTITGGFSVEPNNLGNMTNFTVTPASGNYQYGTNNAAFTLTAPASDCAVDILVTNHATTAGAITFSGFTAPSGGGGDTYATTGNNRYLLMIRRINGVSTYAWKALQ